MNTNDQHNDQHNDCICGLAQVQQICGDAPPCKVIYEGTHDNVPIYTAHPACPQCRKPARSRFQLSMQPPDTIMFCSREHKTEFMISKGYAVAVESYPKWTLKLK